MTQENLPAKNGNGHQPEQLPALSQERLPWHPKLGEAFAIERSQWRVIVESIFPAANRSESVIMALAYCKARGLDIMKRPVHIVPVWDSKQGKLVEHIWPGIGELRTTAFRTGNCAGRDATVFGPDVTRKVGNIEMTFPEWGQVTFYRIVNGHRVPFVGPRVYWLESYAERGGKERDKSPNAMWYKRPRGQLEKCAEAAALRAAFPEELGNEYCAEEAHAVNLHEHQPAIAYEAPKETGGLSVEHPEGVPEEDAKSAILARISDVSTPDQLADVEYDIQQAKERDEIDADTESELYAALNARGAELTEDDFSLERQ